ncbi:MAG TPA: TetR/AcrR family transcriptional regulator [Acidimicrobiales bacterium]|nr:TetR/AcrR family transcriptional regulator [Acidimicrobiales bacterium]
MPKASTGRPRESTGRPKASTGRPRESTGRPRAGERAATPERILDAALASFGSKGYEGSSLDALAEELGLRKQSILYWFPSKEAILEAVIDRSAAELSDALEASLERAGDGWDRVEAVVRSVFLVAARRPELIGLVREVARIGPPAATRLTQALDPLMKRASAFLETEMSKGSMRTHEPRLLLLAIYSTVVGMITEVEVLRALGEEPTARSLVRRRQEILRLLRSALLVNETRGEPGNDYSGLGGRGLVGLGGV